MHHNNDRRCWETLVACIKAVLWQQGYVFAQNSDPVNPGTINQGKRVSGPEGDNPPRSCVWRRHPPVQKYTTCCNGCMRSVTVMTCSATRCSPTIRHPGCAYVPNGLLPHLSLGHLSGTVSGAHPGL